MRLLGVYDDVTGQLRERRRCDRRDEWRVCTDYQYRHGCVGLPARRRRRSRSDPQDRLCTPDLVVSIEPRPTPCRSLSCGVVELPAVVTVDSAPHYISPGLREVRGATAARGIGLLHPRVENPPERKPQHRRFPDREHSQHPHQDVSRCIPRAVASLWKGGAPAVYLNGVLAGVEEPERLSPRHAGRHRILREHRHVAAAVPMPPA